MVPPTEGIELLCLGVLLLCLGKAVPSLAGLFPVCKVGITWPTSSVEPRGAASSGHLGASFSAGRLD